MTRFAPLFLLASIACASNGNDGPKDPPPTSGEPNGPVDDVAPEFVSSWPADGQAGIPEDAEIVLKFSEPMDPATFDQALDTTTLGPVEIYWNDALDEMTILPQAPLAYAEGSGDDPLAIEALDYRVSIDTAAMDQAGNPLAAEVDIVFSTMRQMRTVVKADDALTRSISPSELLYQPNDPFVAGDDDSDGGIRTALTFDLSTVPAGALEIAEARIVTRQLTGDLGGNPYVDLGLLVLDHVTYAHLDDEAGINAAFNAEQQAMDTYDGFSWDGYQASVDLEVTDAVAADFADRAANLDRSQFLLYFDGYTDLDGMTDRAVFSRDALELQVIYLSE